MRFGRLWYVCVKSLCDRPELLPIYSATSLKHTADDTQQHTPPGHIILTTGEPVVSRPTPNMLSAKQE
ncbi:hypothetical protein CI610_03192 [invertebrate metagenome]|uniref:Uncharacterized protein n=1 Tax=invertebrate metagenome TaxID=1711999 RepID=A0A2H9T3V8_9ZZZZ